MDKKEKYLGEINLAKVTGLVDDPVFKMRTTIVTRHFENDSCLVMHGGSANELLDKNIAVRIFSRSVKEESDLIPDDNSLTAYFITSNLPSGFEFTQSRQIILYGIWEARMKDGFHLPVLVKVSKFYNPGPMISLLHYASGENEGFVYPYQLNHRMSPQIIINPHDGKRRAMPRSIGGALRKYVKNLDTVSMQIFPKIVTIEEVLDRNKVIYEIDKTGLEKLEMEPQQ